MAGATVVYEGAVSWPPPPPKQAAIGAHRPAPAKPAATPVDLDEQAAAARRSTFTSFLLLAVAALALLALGAGAPPAFPSHVTRFVLALFFGYHVVVKVTPA